MVDSQAGAPAPKAKPCPICDRPAQAAFKPFCSRRCADIDLGRWLKGSYVIPGAPVEEAETGLKQQPDDD